MSAALFGDFIQALDQKRLFDESGYRWQALFEGEDSANDDPKEPPAKKSKAGLIGSLLCKSDDDEESKEIEFNQAAEDIDSPLDGAELDKENIAPPPLPQGAHQRFGGNEEMPGTLHTSPPKKSKNGFKKRVIYLWKIEGQDESPIEIPHESRLDIAEIFKEAQALRGPGGGEEEVLFQAMLTVELALLKILQAEPRLAYRVIYAGLSEDTVHHRAKKHVQNLKKEKPPHKYNVVCSVLKKSYNIKSSYLLYNVETKYLPVFECLVGELFLVQTFGASEKLGHKIAWKKYNKYTKWAPRAKALSEAGLINLSRNLAKDLGNMAYEISHGQAD